jgi:CMP/dCMP kinase
MAVVVIAIDGPAGAGKGTLARRLAEHFGYAHLDTGSLYRAVALRVLRDGADPTHASTAALEATRLTEDDLLDPALRHEATGLAASQVSAIPAVREALLAFQRDFALKPPRDAKGAVIEGRDIGTVVCPHADHKIFLDASLEVRARRRAEELREALKAVDEASVLRDMRRRDQQDRERATAPLKPAPDAFLLDTSNLDIEGAFAAAKAHILGRSGPVG